MTGGTGSVGRDLVKRLRAADHETVFQFHSNSERARALKELTGATSWQCDFRNAEWALPAGSFDAIVHCAGINVASEQLAEVSLDEWQQTLEVNVTAPFRLLQIYLPAMIAQRFGRIVFVGSIYSVRGSVRNGPYNCSKHALSALMKTVAKEYGARGISANEVLPGAIESDMMHRIAHEKSLHAGTSPQTYLEQVASSAADQRLAHPADVSAAIEFLLGAEAGHINGASLVVDGGTIC